MMFISWAISCSAAVICDWSSDEDEELVVEELPDEVPDSIEDAESSDDDVAERDVGY
ncbi:hypothetical protein [Rhizobium sp. P44RR-XXIV]|uniref:hypothetical protein n=1 Tax=Rhizobium sp. P44RR-XXIV TaxID=1921145 RepID=UPI001FEFBB7F|nr:hypothetical protein [Rhizobium sp. P44RR-XXIV]